MKIATKLTDRARAIVETFPYPPYNDDWRAAYIPIVEDALLAERERCVQTVSSSLYHLKNKLSVYMRQSSMVIIQNSHEIARLEASIKTIEDICATLRRGD